MVGQYPAPPGPRTARGGRHPDRQRSRPARTSLPEAHARATGRARFPPLPRAALARGRGSNRHPPRDRGAQSEHRCRRENSIDIPGATRMTASRDPDELIRAFLDEGQTDLPDRVFDAVRHDIQRTRQRVVIGPWKVPNMNMFARVAIAAAAVVAIGFAWVNFGLSRAGPGVGAQPTPTPTPSPKPLPNSGRVEPGRYTLITSGTIWPGPFPQVAVTVPAGWSAS